jgi:hypothetical protein
MSRIYHSIIRKAINYKRLLWGAAVLQKKIETFAKLHKPSNFVIPAKSGIQYYQIFPRFRVKPGMTNKRVIQRSLFMIRTVED